MLNPRLRHIAKMIEPCEVLIDIGSDHGFLPLYLLSRDIIRTAVISDLNARPLQAAIKNAQQAELTGRCIFIQTDGLPNQNENLDAVVIAGMGFETIAKIIEKDLLRFRIFKQIVIQSNTHVDKLRAFLSLHQFLIIDETLVKDRKHFYIIMKLRYHAEEIRYDATDLWIGPILKHRTDALMLEYLMHLNRIETKILIGQKKESSERIQVIQACLEIIQRS